MCEAELKKNYVVDENQIRCEYAIIYIIKYRLNKQTKFKHFQLRCGQLGKFQKGFLDVKFELF